VATYSTALIVKRVAKARRSGWVTLSLMDCGVKDSDLRTLLDAPGVEQLQGLNLSGNQLSTLPPEIGRLTALDRLYLVNNQLSAQPTSSAALPDSQQYQHITILYSTTEFSHLPVGPE